jgi:hypothetical protein
MRAYSNLDLRQQYFHGFELKYLDHFTVLLKAGQLSKTFTAHCTGE